jgi:hypothetical protein
LNFFIANLNTLCNKTIEDTLITIRQYELARLEFDAYRCDLEIMQQQPQNAAAKRNLAETQRQYDLNKQKYEKLKADIIVKMKFLDENRVSIQSLLVKSPSRNLIKSVFKVKVMQKQLNLHHEAVCAYFSGNKHALEETMKQFSIKPNTPTSFSNTSIAPSELKRSFLEEQH